VIPPRGYQKKSKVKKSGIIYDHVDTRPNEYKPSNMVNAHYGPVFQWRRVNEWDEYINDPIEKLSGHMIIE
jgi:hypothetical protein